MEERALLEEIVAAQRAVPGPDRTRRLELLKEIHKRSFVKDIPGDVPGASPVPPTPEEEGFLGVDKSTWGRLGQNAAAGAAVFPPMLVAARGLNFLSQGSRAAPYVNNLVKAIAPTSAGALGREFVVGAGAGAAAGEGGGFMADRFGEAWRGTGELLAGGVGGVVGNAALSTPMLGAKAAKGLWDVTLGKVFDDTASTALGANTANTRIQRALSSNPELLKNLDSAKTIQDATGVNLPMASAAKDDPSIKSLFSKVTSRQENDAFISEMVVAESTAKQQLADARRLLAADPKDAASLAGVKAAQDNAAQAAERLIVARKQTKREAVVSNIDDKISELSDTMVNAGRDKTKVGESLTTLVRARESAAKAEFKPIYEQLVQEGQQAGVTMPAASVSSITGFVERYGIENLFQASPTLAKTIEGILGKKAFSRDVKLGSGKVSSRVVKQADDSSMTTLDAVQSDSLKRAVNKAIRDNKDSSRDNFYTSLKKEVDDGLDSMGEFGAKLKETDAQYRAKVGEPFLDANGVIAVNNAKFVERTIPMLVTPSSLRELRAASGGTPEFDALARDAWLWKLGTSPSIVKEKGVDVQGLKRFVRDNKAAIEQIPGLEAELLAVGTRTDALQSARSSILQRQRDAGLDAFDAQARKNPTLWQEISSTNGGLVGYVESALKTPDKMSKLIQQAGASSDAKDSLKSAVLEAAFKRGDKLDFFETNKEAFESLFGEGYSKDVRLLLDASERLAQHPFSFRPNPGLSSGTAFQDAVGMSATQASATIRAQISNTFTKTGIFLSKFLTGKAEKAEQAEIMAFLRDRNAVRDSAAIVQAAEEELRQIGSLGVRTAAAVKTHGVNILKAGFFGGLTGYSAGKVGLLKDAPVREQRAPIEEEEE